MSRIAISDRIKNPDIEQDLLGEKVGIEPTESTEILLVWHAVVDQAYIDRLPRLRYIIRYGVGFDRVDTEYARKKGIVVSNTPDYCTDEVADSAIAMILGIARGVFAYDSQCRTYTRDWQENVDPKTKRVASTCLGVIGAGRIGQSVLRRANALKFRTRFFDPNLPSGYDKVLGSERVDTLAELVQSADIVSLHIPLTPETKGMVNVEFLALMKPGASLVNTARGAVVSDIDIFYEPLRSGRLNAVALDVLPEEPPKPGLLIDAWRRREAWVDGRLVINPHSAFHSHEASIEMRRKVAENALRYVNGRPLRDVVN